MKKGTYKVIKVKNEKGQHILNMIGNEKGEPTQVGDTVFYYKNDFKCECDVCGKPTYWSLTNYYEGFIGTECIKNLDLEFIE